MTVVGLGAWCDYVTEDEFRQKFRSPTPPPEVNEHRDGYAPLWRLSGPAVEEEIQHFRRGLSFRVHEFAVLADGRRLTLSDDRGYSTSAHVAGGSAALDPWAFTTRESVEADVLTTVRPDEDGTDEEHPWEWLAQRLHDLGVDVSPAQLRTLPYDVELSDRLRARLP